MPKLKWNQEKNDFLTTRRHISFDDVAKAFKLNTVIAIRIHPNHKKYPKQQIIYFIHKNYTYACPFVTEPDGTLFLKTIYPSRKAFKKYQKGK